MPTKTAILASAFDPRLNYQESVTARTLHRMGHQVTVFTTTTPIVREAADWPGVDAAYPFRIVRTPKFRRVRNTVIPQDKSVIAQLREFAPDVAFLFAPAGGAGYFWMKHLPEQCRVIAFISDLPWHRSSGLLWWLVKRRWLRAVFRRANAVAAVTSQTEQMLRETGGRLLDGKLLMTGLSYDASIFGDGPGRPPQQVAELAGRLDQIIAVVTKAAPSKQLNEVAAQVETVLRERPRVGFVLAGAGNDDYGRKLRDQVECSSVADRCCVLPVLEADEVKGVFELAACSVWTTVSIGIQQSLASGCPVVLREGQPAEHILRDGVNAVFYPDTGALAQALRRILDTSWQRDAIRESIRPWRSDRVLAKLMKFAGCAVGSPKPGNGD